MENKTIRDRIFAEYNNFFDAEKKIANYILNNSSKVVELTIAELDEAAGTSEATVSRFCKKCNVKGFHHLKITLAKELVKGCESEVTASGDVNQNNIKKSLQNILANKVEELSQTVSMIDEENLLRIIKLISGARSIQFAAVVNTIPVAMDGSYKFNQIGIPAVANTIWETQIAYTYNLTKEDVVIVISNSGASKRLLNVAEVAHKKEAKVISITNSANSPLAKISDYHITTATREKLFLDEYYFSRISAMTVIEILYLFLTVGKEDVYDNLSRHEQSIADDKL